MAKIYTNWEEVISKKSWKVYLESISFEEFLENVRPGQIWRIDSESMEFDIEIIGKIESIVTYRYPSSLKFPEQYYAWDFVKNPTSSEEKYTLLKDASLGSKLGVEQNIPYFTSTEEAHEFGRTQMTSEIEQSFLQRREEILEEFKRAVTVNEKFELAFQGQFLREAIEEYRKTKLSFSTRSNPNLDTFTFSRLVT